MDNETNMDNNNIENTNKKASGKKGWLKEFLLIFLYAFLIAAALKTFIVDSRMIPSSSMYPTIEISDRVVLSKLAYIGSGEPARGDIIVFKPPPDSNETLDLIKRVIGLPGETVEIKDGYVYIDGVPLAEDYLNEAPKYVYPAVEVPEGEYFVMGDNRNNSGDSHVWSYPFVPIDDIKGRAVCRYWPLDRIGAL